MARQLEWRELRGGIITAIVIVALTLLIVLFARVGALHGKKVTLYVVADGAPGVLDGTEVWLAGEREGVVKSVTFRPPSAPDSERLLIKTEFLASALPEVRRDSYAQIRPAGSLIGEPIIYISPGTVKARVLHDGDTIATRRAAAIGDLSAEVGKIAPEFAALGAATKELANKIDRGGTIGNYRASGLPDMADVQAGMSSLTARAGGNGTVGRAMRGDLRVRAAHAMAAADSIRLLVASNQGSIGRFRKDTTLVTTASRILGQLDSLRMMLANPIGTIAAAHSDSALTLQMQQTHVLLAALIKDVKKRPLRYIQF